MCEFQRWISLHLLRYYSEIFVWFKKFILRLVVTNFVNIQFVELFKKTFENLNLKKKKKIATAVVEINTISN